MKNTKFQKPVLLVEDYLEIAREYGYENTFMKAYLAANGHYYIGLQNKEYIWVDGKVRSVNEQKFAVLELFIDWEQGTVTGHNVVEYEDMPFDPSEMYVLEDYYIFSSYSKEWMESDEEITQYTPTPEIFYIVSKDGEILSEIYFQGNVECCVPITGNRFVVVSGRSRDGEQDYEDEEDENILEYYFHQLEVYDQYGNVLVRKELFQEKKGNDVSVAVAGDGTIYYTNNRELYVTKDFKEEKVYQLNQSLYRKKFAISESGKKLWLATDYGQYTKLDEISITDENHAYVLFQDENGYWFDRVESYCYGNKMLLQDGHKLYGLVCKEEEEHFVQMPVEKRQVQFLLKEQELTEKYGLQDYTLKDRRIGYDGNLNFLYRKKLEHTYLYRCITLTIDWENAAVLQEAEYDLGEHPFRSTSFVTLLDKFLLHGWVEEEEKGERGSMEEYPISHILIDRRGKMKQAYRLGYSGMQHTDREGNIYIGHDDDMQMFGRREGRGVNVYDPYGVHIWSNPFDEMCVNYASNMSDSGRYWYLYFTGYFCLVGTDRRATLFSPKIVIEGCEAFAVNEDDTKFIFDGGYHKHDTFYEFDFDQTKDMLLNQKRIDFYYGEEPLQFKKLETGGSRMAFLGEDGEIYIYKMGKNVF